MPRSEFKPSSCRRSGQQFGTQLTPMDKHRFESLVFRSWSTGKTPRRNPISSLHFRLHILPQNDKDIEADSRIPIPISTFQQQTEIYRAKSLVVDRSHSVCVECNGPIDVCIVAVSCKRRTKYWGIVIHGVQLHVLASGVFGVM